MFNLNFNDWYNNLLESFLLIENATITQIIKKDEELKHFFNNLILPEDFDSLQENQKIILKKWLAYQIVKKENFNIINKAIDYDILFDNDYNSEIFRNMNKVDYTEEKLEKDNQEYYEKIKQKTAKEYYGDVKDLGLPAINGYKWGSLDKTNCSKYGKSMNHCGNVAYAFGDNILTLYSVANPKIHYLTFIVNDKVLGESKGRNNDKPDKKFLPNIKQLLLSNYIDVIKGMGYKPENNFNFNDFDKKDKQEILEQKPLLDNYSRFQNILNGSNLKYFEMPNGNIVFDKYISNDEFYELVKELHYNCNDLHELVQSVALECKFRKIPLPDYIYKNIINDSNMALEYAADVLYFKNVPQEVLQAIAFNNYTALNYATKLIEMNYEIPDIIINKISENPKDAYNFVNLNLMDKFVPRKLLQGISLDVRYAYQYAGNLLNLYKKLPDDLILQSIANDEEYCVSFAVDLNRFNFETPDIIFNAIIQTPSSIKWYLDLLITNNRFVDQKFYNYLLNNPDACLYYVAFYFIPKEIKIPIDLLDTIKNKESTRLELINYLNNNENKYKTNYILNYINK